MKLNAKQKDLLKELVKSKGQFKTPTIKKDDTEKGFDDIVKLYLKGLLKLFLHPILAFRCNIEILKRKK